MEYLNIQIGNKTYIQRNEFSKLTILNNDGTRKNYNNLSELPKEEQNLLKDAIKIQEKPEAYFICKPVDENEIVIEKYIGTNLKNVVIPSQIDNKKVILSPRTFYGVCNVKNIIVPNGIEKIPKFFCMNASELEKIILSSDTTIIETAAFSGCLDLKYINLDNIEKIETNAFSSCSNLNNINLEKIDELNARAFMMCESLVSINLPKIRIMDKEVFLECENLKSVKLNDELEYIDDAVFYGCINLSKINLPTNLTYIGDRSFCSCKKITNISFPDKLNTICTRAFFNSGLKGSLKFPKNLSTIAEEVFDLTEITDIEMSKETSFEQNSFPLDAMLKISFYEDKEIKKSIIDKTTSKER